MTIESRSSTVPLLMKGISQRAMPVKPGPARRVQTRRQRKLLGFRAPDLLRISPPSATCMDFRVSCLRAAKFGIAPSSGLWP